MLTRFPFEMNVKMLGKEYRIQLVSFLQSEDKRTTLLGEIIEHMDYIGISEDQSITNQELTLFHELIHAILIRTGQSKFSEEEGLIDALATGVHSLIKNNDFEFMKGEQNDTI